MRKVKICTNLQCNNRVNEAAAVVCKGCGRSLSRVKQEFLSENDIEKRLNPVVEEEEKEPEGCAGEPTSLTSGLVVVCPSCSAQIPYQIGLEFCECGEYIADVPPITLGIQADIQSEELPTPCVKGMGSLDGFCRIDFLHDFMKIGRENFGREYFLQYGKAKVSREHIIVKRVAGEWYLSYCKKEDRNYANGRENAAFVNDRMLARDEEYCLQVGDEIALGTRDKTDIYAAFFRVV